jgi:hypothetical protein
VGLIEVFISKKALLEEANMSKTTVKRAKASGRRHKRHFETRVIEYQTGGALSWD